VRARKLHFIEVRSEGDHQILLIQDRTAGLIHRIRDPHLGINEESDVLNNLLALTNGGESVE
jgi:hypothetical protein